MFVQALAAFADRHLVAELGDESFESKPVRYLIEIDGQGNLVGIIERYDTVPRGKKTVQVAQSLPVPRSPVPRNSGLYPLLACDDIKYVLGAGPWAKGESAEKNAAERHQAFVKLISKAARVTGDEALAACERFYSRPDQTDRAREALKQAPPGTLVALSYGGPLTMMPPVRNYWTEHYERVAGARVSEAQRGECLISGRIGPIAPTHERIKGIGLGGQASGVAMMSFDKQAFRSYGWEQNSNSPVSPNRALAYVLALNQLLRRDGGNRTDIAGTAFIFWTKEPSADELDDVMAMMNEPKPAQVKRLLELEPLADPDPNMFYMAGLRPNGARLQIRYWVSESLAQIKSNERAWFEGLRIFDSDEDTGFRYPKLWQLCNVISKNGDVPDRRVIALLRRAIEGRARPLGYEVLAAALNPLSRSMETRRDPVRMGLIRLCVNDISKGEVTMTERLDEGQTNPAYLCGRLLAVYESLQYSTYRSAGESQVNVTVSDRFYSLASRQPNLAFSRIAELGQKHLSKLRRGRREGIASAIEQKIGTIMGALDRSADRRFPPALDLDGQARFALGYYHQRTEDFAQAKARKQNANGGSPLTEEEEMGA